MNVRLFGAVFGTLVAFACGPTPPESTPPDEQTPPEVQQQPPQNVPPAQVPDERQPPVEVNPPTTELTPPPPFQLPAMQTSIQTYELQIPEATLQQFYADVYTPEQPATFIYEGKSYPVKVRLRGASARTFPKKSWNVDFEDLRFEGREELNLVAEYQDQTMIVEKLAYDILTAMKVPVPRTKYVKVYVNGKFEGVFLDIEEVDKKWLKAAKVPDDDATIYRCGSWDCEMKTWKGHWQGNWQKKTNETEPNADLEAFLRVINFTPEPQLADELERVFDLDAFIRMMAAEAIVANNYIEDSESYYVSDRVTGRWYYVPWDLNNSDARWWWSYSLDMSPVWQHPLFPFTLQDGWLQRMYDRRSQQVSGYEPTFDNLRTRILLNPELRARVFDETRRAREELLDPSVLHPRIEAMHSWLKPLVKDDPYLDQAKFDRGLWFLKEFVNRRYDHVEAELQRWETTAPTLLIEAFDPAAGWIELRNHGSASVSTQGLVITTYLRRAVVPSNVPVRSLAPGEKVRFTADQLGVTFAPEGEVGLFDGASVAGMVDALYYGALPSGQRYVRDGATMRWEVQ